MRSHNPKPAVAMIVFGVWIFAGAQFFQMSIEDAWVEQSQVFGDYPPGMYFAYAAGALLFVAGVVWSSVAHKK